MKISKAVIPGVVLLLAAILGARSTDAAEKREYSFGVVPQFEKRKLHAIWKPIIEELQKETGLSFKLVTTLKITDFEKEYQAERFDFAYMNPYYIIRGITPGTYLPLVRDKKSLRGILVVRKDGPIRSVAELQDRTVAFPSPNALGSSLVIRAELERLFHVKVRPLYVKTHSSVYFHVATNLAAAGGGVQKTLQEQDAEVQERLMVLHTAQPMPSHPVSAHKRIPPEVRQKVADAFLAMGRSEEGRALLARIPVQEFERTTLDEYLVMRSWGLDKYWDPAWSEE